MSKKFSENSFFDSLTRNKKFYQIKLLDHNFVNLQYNKLSSIKNKNKPSLVFFDNFLENLEKLDQYITEVIEKNNYKSIEY